MPPPAPKAETPTRLRYGLTALPNPTARELYRGLTDASAHPGVAAAADHGADRSPTVAPAGMPRPGRSARLISRRDGSGHRPVPRRVPANRTSPTPLMPWVV